MEKENKGRILVTPYVGGEYIERLEIHMELPPSEWKDGEILGTFCIRIGNVILTDGRENLSVEDADGTVPYALTRKESPAETSEEIRLLRDAKGPITVSYALLPRRVTSATHSGPYFDLRCEEKGFTFSSEAVFPEVSVMENPEVLYDLSHLPAGAQVCSNGTARGYFACGNLHRYDHGDLTIVCCSDPNFDAEGFLAAMGTLHDRMTEYFGRSMPYTIIFRKDPYLSRGGSAAADAFMAGYMEENPPRLQDKYSLLTHEMAHSFVRIDEPDEIHAAWFNEAVADYTSAMFPYVCGLQDAAYYLDTLNDISKRFFDNPYTEYSVARSMEESWTDTRYIQPLPYGRGFFLLCRMGEVLKDALPGGVMALLAYVGYDKMDLSAVLAYIKSLTGYDMGEEIASWEAGGEIPLADCCFGPDISWHMVPGEVRDWPEFILSES